MQHMAASSYAMFADDAASGISSHNKINYMAHFSPAVKKEIVAQCSSDLHDSQLKPDNGGFIEYSKQRARALKLTLAQYINYLMLHTACSTNCLGNWRRSSISKNIYNVLVNYYTDGSTDEQKIWLELMVAGYIAVEKYIAMPINVGRRQLNWAMVMAAGYGHSAVVERMWQLGGNDIVKALAAAASNGHVQIVQKMQLLGAYDIRVVGYAAGMGHSKVVEFLLQARPNDVNQALALAALYGKLNVITSLLHVYHNYDAKLGFLMAARGGHKHIMILMYDKLPQHDISILNQALLMAIAADHIQTVKWLLSHGATNIQDAMNVFATSDDILRMLVKNGGKNYAGALVATARHDNIYLVEKLLTYKPTQQSLNAALVEAAKYANFDIVQLLIAAGANAAPAALIAVATGPDLVAWEATRGSLYHNTYWVLMDHSIDIRRDIMHFLMDNYYFNDTYESTTLINAQHIKAALLAAAKSGAYLIVESLLSILSEQLPLSNSTDNSNRRLLGQDTASEILNKVLYAAALHNHHRIVKFIMAKRPHLTIIDDIVLKLTEMKSNKIVTIDPNKYGYYDQLIDIPDMPECRFIIIKLLLPQVQAKDVIDNVLIWAADYGYYDLVRQALQFGNDNVDAVIKATIKAAKSGYILILTYLWKLLPTYSARRIHNKLVKAAAQGGHNRIISVLLVNFTKFDENLALLSNFTQADGNLSLLKQRSYSANEINQFINAAARGGHITTMQLLQQYGGSYSNYTMRIACKYERANVVRLLLQEDINIDQTAAEFIAISVNVDLLHILYPQRKVEQHMYFYCTNNRSILIWVP